MQTYNNLFRTKLEELIKEEIARIKDNLALGMGIVDMSDYRHHTGQIYALMKIIELCDEVESNLS
jgi:hypothetical protein